MLEGSHTGQRAVRKRKLNHSLHPVLGKHHRKTIPMEKVRDKPYLKRDAWMTHMYLPNSAKDRGKLLEHARRLKISTLASIWKPLPNLCYIKYIWDSSNKENICQKIELKDKREKETKKVRKNIHECLASNRTAVGIIMRSVLINKEEEAELRRFSLVWREKRS